MEHISIQEFAQNRCKNPKTPNDYKYLTSRLMGDYDQTLRNMYKRATRAQFELGDVFHTHLYGYSEYQPMLKVVAKEKNTYTFKETGREYPQEELTPFIHVFSAVPGYDDDWGGYEVRLEITQDYIDVFGTGRTKHSETFARLIPMMNVKEEDDRDLLVYGYIYR